MLDFKLKFIKNNRNPTVLLYDIIRKLPDFLNTVLVYFELDDRFSLQGLGTYYLGDIYDLNDFINYPGMLVFPTIESLDMETNVFRLKLLLIIYTKKLL